MKKYLIILVFTLFGNLVTAQSNITEQEILFRCWKAYNADITGQKNYTKSWLKKYDKTYNSYANNEFKLSEKISVKESEIMQKLNNIEENKIYYVDYETTFGDYDFSKEYFKFRPFNEAYFPSLNINDKSIKYRRLYIEGSENGVIIYSNTYLSSGLMIMNLDFVQNIYMKKDDAERFLDSRTSIQNTYYGNKSVVDRKLYLRIYYSQNTNDKYKRQWNSMDDYAVSDKSIIGNPIRVEAWADKNYSIQKIYEWVNPDNNLSTTNKTNLNTILGSWTGTYTCTQGVTGLKLTFNSLTEATFEFYPTPQNPNIPSGSFKMDIQKYSNFQYSLTGKSWIERPKGYNMVDFIANFDFNENTLNGKICNYTFTLFKEENKTEITEVQTEEQTKTDIYDRADIMPSFPGGSYELNNYFENNQYYPLSAKINKSEGTVYIKFYVDRDGTVKNPQVIKDGVGNGAADEAIRLINNMPKWNPGSTNGKTVKVYYTLPITFTLPKSSPQFTKVKSNTTTTITNIFDRDDDGVINDKDKCPDIAGSIFAQGCPDRDGDGLMDVDDKCPDVPGPASNKGCPILIEETKSKPPIFTSRNIQFESGKDIIKPTSYIILDEVAEVLKQYPYYTLNIGGHTDNAESYNSDAAQSLSQSRSVNVMNYLIKKGVSPDKLTAFGYGQTKPIADNKTTTGRSQNRRVELNLNFK